jgi:hypothetical protein
MTTIRVSTEEVSTEGLSIEDFFTEDFETTISSETREIQEALAQTDLPTEDFYLEEYRRLSSSQLQRELLQRYEELIRTETILTPLEASNLSGILELMGRTVHSGRVVYIGSDPIEIDSTEPSTPLPKSNIIETAELFIEKSYSIQDFYGVAVSVYGEDCVEISREAGYYNITIHFPEVVITNDAITHTIRNLFFTFVFNHVESLQSKCEGISNTLVYKTTYTFKEFIHRYVHSHIPRFSSSMDDTSGSLCMGDTSISAMRTYVYTGKADKNGLELFFYSFNNWLSWESISGGPYCNLSTIYTPTAITDKLRGNIVSGHDSVVLEKLIREGYLLLQDYIDEIGITWTTSSPPYNVLIEGAYPEEIYKAATKYSNLSKLFKNVSEKPLTKAEIFSYISHNVEGLYPLIFKNKEFPYEIIVEEDDYERYGIIDKLEVEEQPFIKTPEEVRFFKSFLDYLLTKFYIYELKRKKD